jgi:MFS family permease
MRTYRDLFRTPEFRPLFLTTSVQVAGGTVTGLALGTQVFAATGSPLLAALGIFGPALAQLLGASLLLSAADRLPPRAALAGLGLLFAGGAAVQAIPGLPVWAIFVILAVVGVGSAVRGGVSFGLLHEILPEGGFVLGRSVLNMSVGIMQICGFATGGVLVAVLSPRGTLLCGAGLFLLAALAARCGLRRRPPRASDRPSVRQTWRDNALLWSSVPRRYVYLASWVPNGLIVGCESLFVPYSPAGAGLLFAVAAFGMLAGDTLAGRFLSPRWRERLAPWLRLLLGAPYLLFAVHPPVAVAVAAVAVASVGYSATLLLQHQLLQLTPDELSGHALGLQASGMMAMQGIGAAIAGGIAQFTSPAAAMAILAVASVAITLALAPGLHPAVAGAHDTRAGAHDTRVGG